MIASVTVRQDKLLRSDVNPIYKMYVYDESSSKTDELAAAISKLVRYQVLDLSQLEGYQGRLSVSCHNVGIVPVSRDEYQVVCRYSQEFCSFGYCDESGHWRVVEPHKGNQIISLCHTLFGTCMK